ncbi:MAG TPA: ABC transporter substrate-binding protein [Limnochordales bacterium]
MHNLRRMRKRLGGARIALLLAAVAAMVLGLALGYAGAQAPRRGGHLTIAQSAEPPVLDPMVTTATAASNIVHHNVLEGLVKLDRDGNIVPGLAEAWTVSPDATEYVFRLRQGVRFHNGQPFTAADVKAKFEKARDPNSGHTGQHYYVAIESVETPDDYTVVFRMSEPDAEFLYNLARPDSVIPPAGYGSAQSIHPIGTGPFRFVEWVRGSHVRLERFDGYYKPELPYLDSVTFRFIADPNAQVAALLAGDIDAIGGAITAEQAFRVQQAPGFKVIEGPSTNTVILAMNNSRAPLSDVRVRRAISHAINREEVMLGAEFGFGQIIGSHMTPAEPYYVDLTGMYPYDPARARQLLAEAGYPNGFRLTLSLPTSYTYAVRSGEIMAQQLSQVGIEVDIELVEWATWLSRIYGQADYDLTVIGHAEPMDISNYGRPDYYYRYDSAEARELLAAARRTGDEEQRREIYARLQEHIARDAVNVWLYARPFFILSRADVYGWWEKLPVVVADLTEVYFSR